MANYTGLHVMLCPIFFRRGNFMKKEFLIFDKNVDHDIVVAQVSRKPLNNSSSSAAGKEFYTVRVGPTLDRLLVLA
eukprot:2052945-Pyramimonas_sp.AAC.2